MKKEVKKLKEFQRWFDKFIERNYGKKCREFVWDCPSCHAYFVKEILDDFINDLIETEKWISKKETPRIKK